MVALGGRVAETVPRPLVVGRKRDLSQANRSDGPKSGGQKSAEEVTSDAAERLVELDAEARRALAGGVELRLQRERHQPTFLRLTLQARLRLACQRSS